MKFNKSLSLTFLALLFVFFGTIQSGKDQSRGYTTWRDTRPDYTINISGDRYFKDAFIELKVGDDAWKKYPGRIWKFELSGSGIENLDKKYSTYVLPRNQFLTGNPISNNDRKWKMYRELHNGDFTPNSNSCLFKVIVTVYKNQMDFNNNKPEDLAIFRGKVPNTQGVFENIETICRNNNYGQTIDFKGMRHRTGLGFVGYQYVVKVRNGALELQLNRED